VKGLHQRVDGGGVAIPDGRVQRHAQVIVERVGVAIILRCLVAGDLFLLGHALPSRFLSGSVRLALT